MSTQLLHSLNRFLSLITSQGTGQEQTLSAVQLKVLANFLRLNLLSPLRKLEPAISANTGDDMPHRDVLIQWWLSLLNFLNSNLIAETVNVTLTMDVLSVSMECVSRIISLTVLDSAADKRDQEIYSYHILLTVRWITNKLVLNSRRRNDLLESKRDGHTAVTLQFIKSYTSVLTPLIGKVIAFGFCFLNDDLHYDYEVVKYLTKGRFTTYDISGRSMLAWRTKQFVINTGNEAMNENSKSQEQFTQNNPLEEETPESKSKLDPVSLETKKVFQIMISYLQNHQVFSTFLWHYWFNVLNYHHTNKYSNMRLDSFPGCNIILHYCSNLMANDLEKLSRFIKIQDRQEKQTNSSISRTTLANGNQGQNPMTREKIINFVFTKFQCIRTVESLRSLIGFFTNTSIDEALLEDFFLCYEEQFIVSSSTISAYDSWSANIVFNKLFQFLLFQFDTLPFIIKNLSWQKWILGILGTLRTLNADSQTVGLLALFNIWEFVPLKNKEEVIDLLINELWDKLSIETDFHIINILFNKFIVFKVLPDEHLSEPLARNIKEKFKSINDEVNHLVSTTNSDFSTLVDEKNVLLFHNNNRLILECQKPLNENDMLLLTQYKPIESNNRNVNTNLLFANMSRINNVRPAFIICRGKVPFDACDELVARAAIMLAQNSKSRKEINATNTEPSSGESSLYSNEQDDHSDQKKNTRMKFGFGSLLSSFGKGKQPEVSPQPESQTKRGSVGSAVTVDTFDSHEMMSMHSTVSSITSNTSKSESSENLLFKLSQQTRTQAIAGDNEVTKKRKLLAPPESKFSREIISKPGIEYVFKIATVNSPISQRKILLDKVENFNKKWGVKTMNPYDKPLPNPIGRESDTLIDGFNFDSLAPTIEELQQLNIVDDSFSDLYQEQPISREIVPQVDLSFYFDDIPAQQQSRTFDLINCADTNLSNVENMKQITRLTKLMKVVHTFNLTTKEFIEFRNIHGEKYVFMELDPGFHQFHSLNKGLLAVANYK